MNTHPPTPTEHCTRNESTHILMSYLIHLLYGIYWNWFLVRHKKYCEKNKDCHFVCILREKNEWFCIEKIYFFFTQIWNVIYSNVVGFILFHFAPTFFIINIFFLYASLYSMVCRIGVTAEWEKKIERVNFF